MSKETGFPQLGRVFTWKLIHTIPFGAVLCMSIQNLSGWRRNTESCRFADNSGVLEQNESLLVPAISMSFIENQDRSQSYFPFQMPPQKAVVPGTLVLPVQLLND